MAKVRLEARPELKKARQKAGFRVSEVANAMGINPSTIHRWESGDRSCSLDDGIILARLYSTSAGKLFDSLDPDIRFGRQLYR